jgi:hypothetical protein
VAYVYEDFPAASCPKAPWPFYGLSLYYFRGESFSLFRPLSLPSFHSRQILLLSYWGNLTPAVAAKLGLEV